MALAILNELHNEITRLYIAGSSLAVGDPRIKKYIPQLQKLGEKAPVFNTLAERLTTLVEGDTKTSPTALMEAGVLLYSLRLTQGTTETGKAAHEMLYAEKDLETTKAPYSRFSVVMEQLTSNSHKKANNVTALFKSKQYNDPRLFSAYCQAVIGRKTPISDYVAETIIPAIGIDMIPYIEKTLDLKGNSGHARLFKLLYNIKGKEILPLAEKALAEGSPELVSEALRIMGSDSKYEETLLEYTKDKKFEFTASAFYGLMIMGSEKGEALLLEALKKTSIEHLEEALSLSKNPDLCKKMIAEAFVLRSRVNDDRSKLRILLYTFAKREEEAGIKFLEKTLSDKDYFNNNEYSLRLTGIMDCLLSANTKTKNEAVYNISKTNASLVHYTIESAVRFFSTKEEVYEHCQEGINKLNSWTAYNRTAYNTLCTVYGIKRGINDKHKTWDRRWGERFTNYLVNVDDRIADMLYDDDEESWTKLLEHTVKKISRNKNEYYFPGFVQTLKKAFKNKHPKIKYFYDEFIKAGIPKEYLSEIIV